MGRRGLGAKLVGVSVLALALAFALFYLVSGVAAPAVQDSEWFRQWLQDREQEQVRACQEQVRERGLTVAEAVSSWQEDAGALGDGVYSVVISVVDKPGARSEDMQFGFTPAAGAYTEDWVFSGAVDLLVGVHEIVCADGTMYLTFSRSSLWLESLGRAVGLLAALAGFCGVMVPYIWRLLGRIGALARETGLLMAGDLDHAVSAPGSDELSRLGADIERLRLSVVERIGREREAVGANSRLIAELSHDLRTPLTKLMGYLEILRRGEYQTEAERADFLRLAQEKAEQIKGMTDQLFAGAQVESRKEPLADPPEPVDGPALLGQILSEQCGDLQREGFAIRPPVFDRPFGLYLRTEDVLRVFDNLFSNLRKYADRSAPVDLWIEEGGGTVRLHVENRVSPAPDRRDSHGVGLPAMAALMERGGGTLETEERDGVYRCVLTFVET